MCYNIGVLIREPNGVRIKSFRRCVDALNGETVEGVVYDLMKDLRDNDVDAEFDCITKSTDHVLELDKDR